MVQLRSLRGPLFVAVVALGVALATSAFASPEAPLSCRVHSCTVELAPNGPLSEGKCGPYNNRCGCFVGSVGTSQSACSN